MYTPVRTRISAPFLAPLSSVAPKLVPSGEYRGAANDNALGDAQAYALAAIVMAFAMVGR